MSDNNNFDLSDQDPDFIQKLDQTSSMSERRKAVSAETVPVEVQALAREHARLLAASHHSPRSPHPSPHNPV